MVQSEREISELEISKEGGEAKVMFMGMFMGMWHVHGQDGEAKVMFRGTWR